MSKLILAQLHAVRPNGATLVWFQKQYGKRVSALLTHVGRILARRQTLGIINLITTVFLLVQWFGVIRRLATTVPFSNAFSLPLSQLSYPVDIAIQSRSRRLPQAADLNQSRLAGYSEVRSGTFRSRYPSNKLSDVFDEVFVITNPKCPSQWDTFQSHAMHAGLKVRQWPVMPFRRISLASPPIPLARSASLDDRGGNKQAVSILKRQVSYLDAHRRIWQHVTETRKQRVLILDDSIFPSDRLRQLLPTLFNNVDQESIAGQTPWHLVTFRRKTARWNTSSTQPPEAAWCSNPHYNHAVVRARPSYGSGMYAISIGGAFWMLEHVREYRAPMDVEIALLQKENEEEFVALSACNNDEPREFCPDLAEDISLARTKHNFECSWRRLHERIISDQADKIKY
jgi:hypothetical protein